MTRDELLALLKDDPEVRAAIMAASEPDPEEVRRALVAMLRADLNSGGPVMRDLERRLRP